MDDYLVCANQIEVENSKASNKPKRNEAVHNEDIR